MIVNSLYLTLLLTPALLFGDIFVNENPIGDIEGPESLIKRPEGIAFSQEGNYIAVACYRTESVLFYFISPGQIMNTPFFELGGAERPLGGPHDVAFSPDGSQVAVACRKKNQASVHRRLPNGLFEQEPFMVIEGGRAALKCINAIKYSPSGNCLAICDLEGQKVALFRYGGEDYETAPYQSLEAPGILRGPDGLAFSRDGKLLAVTSHEKHSLVIFERDPDGDGKYFPFPLEVLEGEETLFCYPHSVCFHPLDDTLFVSSAGGKNTLSLYRKISDVPPYYSSIPSQTLRIYNPDTIHRQEYHPEEGGVKGIAISPDGSMLGTCASDIGNVERAIVIFAIEH